MNQMTPAGARCSVCGLRYELGEYIVEVDGSLPWLVLTVPADSMANAFANAICQKCHGYKAGGISLRDSLAKIGAKLDIELKLLTREDARRRAQGSSRQSVGVQHVRPSGRQNVGVAPRPQGPERVEINACRAPQTTRQSVGVAAPQGAGRTEVRAARSVVSATRTETRRPEPPRPERPKCERQAPRQPASSLGAENLAMLQRVRDALVVEQATERETKRLESLKAFKATIAQAKGFLTRARKMAASGGDADELVSAFQAQILKASHNDVEKRDEDVLMALVGTSEQEIIKLCLAFYVDKTVTPGVMQEVTSYRTKVWSTVALIPRTRRVTSRSSTFPRPNSPLRETVAAGSLDEVFPKIVYNQGDRYGDAFLVFPDERHLFEEQVNADRGPEPFMGKGQMARMTYINGEGWCYEPYDVDNKTKYLDPRVGSFERGFISLGDVAVFTVAIVLNDAAVGSTRTRLRNLAFECQPDDPRLQGKNVWLIVVEDIELPKKPTAPRQAPTETQCVRLPDAPPYVSPRP